MVELDSAWRSNHPISLCMRTDFSGWTQCLIYHVLKKTNEQTLICQMLSPHFLSRSFLTKCRRGLFISGFHTGSEWTFSYCCPTMVIISLSRYEKVSGGYKAQAALYWILIMQLSIRTTLCEFLMASQYYTCM